MLFFYTVAPPESFQKDLRATNISPHSWDQEAVETFQNFPFATQFFKRFHFLLNLRLSSLEVKTFSEEPYRGLFN